MKAELRKIWSLFFLLAFIVVLSSCEKDELLEPGADPLKFTKSHSDDGPDNDEDSSGTNDGDITDDEDDQDDGDITDDEDDEDDADSRSNANFRAQNR